MIKKTLLKSWLLLLCMVVGVGSAWADEYELYSGAITEGDYIVYYNGYAMNTTVENGRLGYVTVTPSNDIITTDNSAIVWHIAASGDYWTLYNADANAYAAGTGAKNKAQMLADGTEDKALWTVSGTSTYEFVNKANTAAKVNANLRNNGTYGFACYATGTGGALSLYKKKAVVKTDPTIIFNNGSVRVGQDLDLSTLFESNSTGAVTYSITDGESYASLDGNTLTGVAEGSVTVKAEQDAAGNYNAGEASATITVNAALALSSIAITTAPTKTIYTEGETFDPTGMVVTATYSDSSTDDVTASCSFSPSTALTTSDTEITVSYTENAVEKTTTQAITVNALPKYTVTFADDSSTETQTSYGASVTLPSRSETAGYAFAGWSETNVTEETTTDPGIIPAGSYTPTANITLYPVYTKTEGGSAPSAFAVGDTGNYAIVAEDNGEYYALPTNPTVNSGKITAQEITVSEIDDVKFVTPENATGFIWTIAEATNGYTISDGSNYIYHSNGGASGTNLAYGDLTTYTWSFTADEGGYIKMASMSGSTTNGRGLLFNSNNKAIGGYALSNWDNSSYCKTMILPIANAGTTYYWSAPVAAAVARPTIEVAENPFMFSTTATITCETEGAAIKYSFDSETWYNYTEALTITETTTLYAKAVKDENESTVASVEITKNLATPTVAIDATGITNTNVFDGTEAGSLAATVTYNEKAVEGAVVTWSGNNDEVATIDAGTGAVTLVAAGTVTFTATYAGNSDYAEKTATYEMTVTNTDPNAPGTENNPYTVAQALENTPASGTSANVYIRGIVSAFYKTSITGDGTNYRYYISDDGTTTNQMLVYRGKGLNNVAFSAADDLLLGDVVTIVGGLTTYNTTKEVASGNYIVSLVRKPAAPEFSVAEGEYASTQTVELTAAEGATIYYTLDGTDPTTESSVYSEALTIEETTTLKAIAVKDEMSSDVATATYTINKAPFITVAETAIEAEAAGKDGTIEVTYNNMTQDEFVADVVYCDAEGNEVTDATYGWIIASINEQTNNIDYLIEENTSTEARTAYIKVYALYDDDDYFSDIITFTQAGMVVDYATLPFEYDGNATGELPTGLTQEGLGTKTYANSPKIGFDTTGDELVLKINEAPVSLFFDIKGNGFSDGTFTVQTSVDGVDYTDLKAYTDLGATQTEIFNLNADVRYIKWIYTEKVNGNVGMGNIKVIKDASIVISDAKYATFSSTLATNFSETGITVYTAKVNGNYVTLTKVEDGIVPANTGVVLYSETAKTYEVPFTTTENSLEDNDLLISDGNVEGDGSTIFALANKKQGVGFYRVAEGVAVPAGTPYLTIEAAAREFFGFGSETTSINGALSIKNGASVDAPVYNLNGQRILKPAKGLYIVNGKKTVIK